MRPAVPPSLEPRLRLPLKRTGLCSGRYAAPDNGGEPGDAYLADGRRSGHGSRIHSAPTARRAFTNSRLAWFGVTARTRSVHRRSLLMLRPNLAAALSNVKPLC